MLDEFDLREVEKVKLKNGHVELRAKIDKRNPLSLRLVLCHLVYYLFGQRRIRAVEIMNKNAPIYVSERKDRKFKNMNGEALKKIFDDNIHIEYWHIEEFAKSSGIPSGAILSLSRMYALIRDQDGLAAEEYVSAMKQFVEILDEIRIDQSINEEKYRRIVQCFEEFLKTEKRMLPLQAP